MPIPPQELRPRGAVALFDAALRLCARKSGVWALTLPGAAGVTSALFHLVEHAQRGSELGRASVLLAAAWLARGLCQGAACHYTQELLLGTRVASVGRALLAALRRAPSLLVTTSALLLVNVTALTFTLGLASFFLSAQGVAYAVTMEGRGHPLGFWRRGAAQLGPSRGAASVLQWLFAAQGLVLFNVHLATGLLLFLARKLLALDVTYLERFASLDNASWWAFLVAVTFGLFEPLRAAAASLVLVDARVRREGLDLEAILGQLPARPGRTVRLPASLVLLAGLLPGALLAPASARAESAPLAPAEVVRRLRAVAQTCVEEEWDALGGESEEALLALPLDEQVKLQRFLLRLERTAYEEGLCEDAVSLLETGLVLAQEAAAGPVQVGAHARAEAILARAEFQAPAPAPSLAEDASSPAAEALWERLERWWRALRDWLARAEDAQTSRTPSRLPFSGTAAASAVVALLMGAVAVLLVALLLRARRRGPLKLEAEVTGRLCEEVLPPPPEGALSRPAEAWAHLAERLAAQGRHREAVRSLYLALLARLHQDGAISYGPTLSNWDALRTFRGPREAQDAFRELTLHFDFVWYGHATVGAEGYEAFRMRSRPFLAPSSPEAAGA